MARMSTPPTNLRRADGVGRAASGLLLALALTGPSATWADANLAANMGCLNCHGSVPRGDAPSFERLRESAGKGERDSRAGATHWLEEMRGTASGPRAIVGHREVTDSTARALVDWLSRPPTQPVR